MDFKVARSVTLFTNTHSKLSGTWKEILTRGALPRRRSYHSSVTWRNTLFILGGQDLRDGALEGLWMIRLDSENSESERWVRLKVQNGPPALSRHSAVVVNDSMYVYGGTNTMMQFNVMYVLDLERMVWRKISPESENFPPKMDSHSCVEFEGLIVFFAGYVDGCRSNLVHLFEIATESWRRLEIEGSPPVRSNQSASLHKSFLYIFGGFDEDHSALSDFWKLNLSTWQWTPIPLKGDPPAARSGHTCVVLSNFLILFGGIKEIGHETNELFYCNLETHDWALVFQSDSNIKTPALTNYLAVQMSPSQTRKSVDGAKIVKVKEEIKEKNMILKENPKVVVVPCGRDGHSACLIKGRMYVFGGDKHQMSFNDLFVYSLE